MTYQPKPIQVGDYVTPKFQPGAFYRVAYVGGALPGRDGPLSRVVMCERDNKYYDWFEHTLIRVIPDTIGPDGLPVAGRHDAAERQEAK
jgi:hypothetical protein